ncbi:hypothetical protein T492DRAFT_872814 [Pavlovales sp. CCMP2436]|nr:hypothetical protein T492DRAFT_872814 [Pavlovales sp. CCMP2436]
MRCDCCEGHYTNLDEHLESAKHRGVVESEGFFKSFDAFVAKHGLSNHKGYAAPAAAAPPAAVPAVLPAAAPKVTGCADEAARSGQQQAEGAKGDERADAQAADSRGPAEAPALALAVIDISPVRSGPGPIAGLRE